MVAISAKRLLSETLKSLLGSAVALRHPSRTVASRRPGTAHRRKSLPSPSPKLTPPGPFPSLVTGDTFTHNTPETKTRPIAKIKAQPLVQAANHDQKTPWGSVGEKTGWADPLLRPERRESRCWPN